MWEDASMSKKTKQYITHEKGDKYAWICICKNYPAGGGFYPCDMNGNEVEPTRNGPWDGRLYVCAECKRILDQFTLEVIGQNLKATMLEW